MPELSQHSKARHTDVQITALGLNLLLSTRSQWTYGVISLPSMVVEEMSPMRGTFEEETLKLSIPVVPELQEFLDNALLPGVQFPSEVQVIESFFAQDGTTLISKAVLFAGEIQKVIENVDGRKGFFGLVLTSTKTATDFTAGLPNGETCPWALFSTKCGVSKAIYTYSATILSVNNETLTVVASGGPGLPDGLFTRGYFEKDTIRVNIRQWSSSSPGLFYIGRKMPPSWVGETVELVAGCDNRIETCREVFNNEKNNGAIGISAVDYTPSQETGG